MLLKQHKVDLLLIYKKEVKIEKYKKLFNNNKVWIFKFIYGSLGENIIVLDSYEKFKKFVFKTINQHKNNWKKINHKIYNSLGKKIKTKYFIDWVLQEYIINPMLYQDKKFHLRGYFVFCNDRLKNKKKGYFLDNQRVFTAKLPFKQGDYSNKQIHDSHANSTPYEINYKPDIINLLSKKQVISIENQLKYLYKSLFKILDLNCYKNDEMCFNIFGSDIMITDDYQIKFIELNEKPGMHNYKNSSINYTILFKEVLDKIVDKKYPPSLSKKKKKIIKNKNNKKLRSPKLIKL